MDANRNECKEKLIKSHEAFALRIQAVWSAYSTVVDSAHRFVTLIARKFDLVILNNILFHNRVAAFVSEV